MSVEWQRPVKRGAFDLLPLVVQAPGEKPEWRNLPERLVKEAEIEPPDLPWFSDLKLKWYALPAVFSPTGTHD